MRAKSRKPGGATPSRGSGPGRRSPASRGRLDVVVPVFNEGAGLEAFHESLTAILATTSYQWRVLYVDDGSNDATRDVLTRLSRGQPQVAWIRLTRNFGYQAALTAGLEHADADVIGTMDGDGEHPPSLLPEMLRLIESGFDVVLTARKPTGARSRLVGIPRGVFYRLLNLLSDTKVVPGVTDFRLMSRKAWIGLLGMRERHRYLRGMISWMGFRSVILPFDLAPRRHGASRWTLPRLIRLAGEAILSFSLVPLVIGLLVGLLFLMFAVLEAIYVISLWVLGMGGQIAPGWSSLMFVLLIVGSTLMISLSIVGIYAGLTYQEVKRRPMYLIEATDEDLRRPGRASRTRGGAGPGTRSAPKGSP